MSEQHEIAGKFWDSLSTAKRIIFLLSAFGLGSALFAGGFWFAHQFGENKLAALEARHEIEIAELKSNSAPEWGLEAYVVSATEDVPDLENADDGGLSMAEYAALREVHREESDKHLSIDKPPPFEPRFARKRFTWKGYVADVGIEEHTEPKLYRVALRLNPDPGGFFVECYFTENYGPQIRKLKRHSQVAISGVLGSSGRTLHKCNFAKLATE